MVFTLTSPAFRDGAPLPVRYTADGEGLSPPLAWSDPPAGTRSFVIVCEDSDAPSGTFRHWALHGIPGTATEIPEGEGNRARSRSAINDLGDRGYASPGPPHGHGPHHYHFRLAALDVESIEVPHNARVADVWRIANRHLLGTAEIVGVYER